MARFNLSLKILVLGLVAMTIFIFAQRTKAYNQYTVHNIVLAQNEQNMNNMNMDHMDMNHMNMNNMPERIKKGYAISPVSQVQVKITKDTPFTIYGDRKYYFASEQEKQEFLKDPKKYLDMMMPRKVNNSPEK